MTVLPIISRELRVAARKRATFWIRMAAAIVGLFIGAGFLLLSSIRGMGTAQMGAVLFNVLTWLLFAGALASGLFFTSDCLSEEKRDGTIGFLFLTDLSGIDIVGGKLTATSMRAFFALVSIFPVLAITLLMGQVTGLQLCKTSIALVNAMFSSLAVGLMVSALSRDSQRAMGATLFLILLVSSGGPLLDGLRSQVTKSPFSPFFSFASPAYAFVAANDWTARSGYWTALLISHFLSWFLLALAALLIPRMWQDKRSFGASTTISRFSYRLKYGGERMRKRLRSKLLDRSPILWLACRERWQALGIWLLVVVVVPIFGYLFVTDRSSALWMFWNWSSNLIFLALYLLIASQASRFFVEARRTGLIELLLAAPLTTRSIIRGQWYALLRMFGLPLLILLLVTGAGVLLAQIGMASTLRAQAVNRTIMFPVASFGVAALTGVVEMLKCLANLTAIAWFGMWMGCTSKSTNVATLKTLLFVQVIPSFAITFLSGIGMVLMIAPGFIGANPTYFQTWMPALSVLFPALLALLKDFGFLVLTRRTLDTRFRDWAIRSEGFKIFPAMLQSKSVVPPPPIIQSTTA